MYKVIRLESDSNFSLENYVVFKCKISEAAEMLEIIDSIYTMAKLSEYDILVATVCDNFSLSKFVLKFVNENKTVIVDFYINKNFVIEDILLNNGDQEHNYIYNELIMGKRLDNKTIGDFNKSLESIPNKFRKLLNLL